MVFLNRFSSKLILTLSKVRMTGRNNKTDDKFYDDFTSVKRYAHSKIINEIFQLISHLLSILLLDVSMVKSFHNCSQWILQYKVQKYSKNLPVNHPFRSPLSLSFTRIVIKACVIYNNQQCCNSALLFPEHYFELLWHLFSVVTICSSFWKTYHRNFVITNLKKYNELPHRLSMMQCIKS